MDEGTALLEWFEHNARPLPWREEPRDPYRTLVAEVMLQQTQVDRVVPRFRRFVEVFPDVRSLAAASEDAVLEAWSGLGYYGRARRLHRAARELAALGRFPETAAALRELPGIGEYTAAAVAALAFGERVPVLDGNVLRVGARRLALAEPARSAAGRRRIAGWLLETMTAAPPGRIAEATMELGALVCRPTAPACRDCPLRAVCRAARTGTPQRWPRPRRTRSARRVLWAAAVVVDPEGRLLLRRIEEGPVLRGLWLPPLTEVGRPEDAEAAATALAGGLVSERSGTPLPPVRHTITHRRIEVYPVRFTLAATAPAPPGHRWARPDAPGLATSSLLGKLVRAAALVGDGPV